MAVTPSSIDLRGLWKEQLLQASLNLIRDLLQMFINTLLSAEADAVCGAEYGQTSDARQNRRSGYRHRGFDTRAGTLDVAVPNPIRGANKPRLREQACQHPTDRD